ncbi:MAG: hypothetical protein Q8Q59_10315 [Luteolibacter sp.]|jgi:hypothetical protein|nr:hypothetical protein [Luteolibacter sp.]
MILLESMLALSILTVIGLTLLKLSLNVLHPRQWALQQSVTDAYMTYERALAERVPFEALLAENSLWPAYPSVATTANETIGRLPGGGVIRGTVTRTRFADSNNYPIDGGDASRTREQALAANPAAIKVWKAQSVLTYQIGNRTYAKTRTVIRSQ